jgi:hypothetical protein
MPVVSVLEKLFYHLLFTQDSGSSGILEPICISCSAKSDEATGEVKKRQILLRLFVESGPGDGESGLSTNAPALWLLTL